MHYVMEWLLVDVIAYVIPERLVTVRQCLQWEGGGGGMSRVVGGTCVTTIMGCSVRIESELAEYQEG